MPQTAILTAMLQRLYASMAQGPSMNCRPHASRHRLDLMQVSKLQDAGATEILKSLLTERRQAAVNTFLSLVHTARQVMGAVSARSRRISAVPTARMVTGTKS